MWSAGQPGWCFKGNVMRLLENGRLFGESFQEFLKIKKARWGNMGESFKTYFENENSNPVNDINLCKVNTIHYFKKNLGIIFFIAFDAFLNSINILNHSIQFFSKFIIGNFLYFYSICYCPHHLWIGKNLKTNEAILNF